MAQGPLRSYLPDPTKIILVVSPRNVPQAEAFFWGYRLQIVVGGRYLGGFIGTNSEQVWWLGNNIVGWQDLVATLDWVEFRHL